MAGILLLFGVFATLCSCTGYYWQSVQGQLGVFSAQQPIESLLENPPTDLPVETQAKLETVLKARQFASDSLQLPRNDSFTLYANLKRPYVVWSVMASPALSLEATQWCYPVVGCAAYRGYFKQSDAEAFASELKGKGFDVVVSGIPAYSTLGWFDDPVFHPVLSWPETSVVGLIFHELAHAQLYIKGDSTFNESFATAVEIAGVRQWLKVTQQPDLLEQFEKKHALKKAFIDFVLSYRRQFKTLYSSDGVDEVKRQEKAKLMTQMQADYQKIKIQWGSNVYDPWMASLNNAKLNTLSTYYKYVPKLLQEIENKKEFKHFYRYADTLSDFSIDKRARVLSSE